MKKLMLAFVAGAAVASAASAFAVSANQSLPFAPGDSAHFTARTGVGTTTCAVVSKQGSPMFSCYIGDGQGYRKRFGVTINEKEVTVNQYFGPVAKPYKMILRRIQGPTFIAH